MGKVQIGTVLVEGFGSIHDSTLFNFNTGAGVTLIGGKNGAGKTTIFSALCWGYFGINLKGVKKANVQTWQRLRGSSFVGTRVIANFSTNDTDYAVARHIKYSGKTFGYTGRDEVMLFSKPSSEIREFVTDDLCGEAQHNGDIQAKINSLFGISDKAFLNSIVFGQRMARLVSAPNEEKRKLFEELFETEFIGEAKANCDKKIVELNSDFSNAQRGASFEENDLKHLETAKIEYEDRVAEFKLNQKDRLKELAEKQQIYFDDLDEAEAGLAKTKENAVKEPKSNAELAKASSDSEALYNDMKSMHNDTESLIRSLMQNIEESKNVEQELLATQKEAKLNLKNLGSKPIVLEDAVKLKKDISVVEAELKEKEAEYTKLLQAYTKLEGKLDRLVSDKTLAQEELINVKTECRVCGSKTSPVKIKEIKHEIQLRIDTLTKAINESHAEIEQSQNEIVKQEQSKNTCSEILAKLKATLTLTQENEGKLVEWELRKTNWEGAVERANNLIARNADACAKAKEGCAKAEHELIPMSKKLSKLKEDYDKAKSDLEKSAGVQVAYTNYLNAVKSYEEKIERTNKAIAQVEADFDKTKVETYPPSKRDFDAVIKEAKNKYNDYAQKMNDIEAELENYKWWSTKGFSSLGLKSFVFSSMLEKVNEYAIKYASRLGLRVEFGVDLSKPSKPFITRCYKGGNELDYEDLSGGQQQRLDVCLAFALHDAVSAKSSFNILLMDEVFEGLDDDGYEAIFDLIRLKAQENKSVYVIAHSDNVDVQGCKLLTVKQDKNEWTVIE